MIEEFSIADYTIIVSLIVFLGALFVVFFKRPKAKKDFYSQKGKPDKDIILVYGGQGGAGYINFVDKRATTTVYHDGTIDIKLVDGTELKHVDLEENLKLVDLKGLFFGPIILACNIDATNRVRDWATADVIKAKVAFSSKFAEMLKAEGRDFAMDILELKKRYEGEYPSYPSYPPGG